MWEVELKKDYAKVKSALLKFFYKIGKKSVGPLYEQCLIDEIKSKPIPQHVGIILDGNRRWARARRLPPFVGHEKGVEKIEVVVDCCAKLGIKSITLYTLSTENLKRDKSEVSFLFNLLKEKIEKLKNDERIEKYRIRIKAIGNLALLPQELREKIEEAEILTKDNDGLFLNFAIAYGGRSEIVNAVRSIVKKAIDGEIDPYKIDEKTIESHLYTSHLPQPSPDLIIRTGGEERLSNFLLWQAAYSELVFFDVLWPDFRAIDFYRAIRAFQSRERRFGK